MSPIVEALVLPVLFLTVVLAGAIRPGGDVSLVPPSLGSLALAMVLMSILARSGALATERLVGASRTTLQNASGVTVLMAVFAASAQVVTLVIPESGVPELIGWVVLISLLLQTLAIAPDRARVRRGLAVTFGAAFVLKFVLLAALSSPAEGGLARALQLVFDGVTLGSVTQRAIHAAEGYLAFATLLLYLVGVAALPGSTYAASLKSPICASNARWKAGRAVQRSMYAASRLSLVTMSVCFRIRSTVDIIRSPAVKRSPSRKGLSPSDLERADRRVGRTRRRPAGAASPIPRWRRRDRSGRHS